MKDLRKFIATTIREYLNENDDPKFYNRFIGYHCSDNANLETERSSLNLGEDDYWEWHEEVLKKMEEKYPLSTKYLNKIGYFDVNKRKYVGEEIGFDTKLTNEINNFLNKLKIKGIFVNDNKPNSRWGKYCYEVYFDKIEFDPIQDFKMLDEGDENSFLYIYQKEKPKFRKIDNIVNESVENNRIYLSQNGTDGFGHVMDIRLKNIGKKIGSIVFRQKKYLKDYGYPLVLELHIGFDTKYQRQGFFQESLIKLLEATDTPIYIASGRVINPDVFKAIDKIDRSLLNVEKIEIEVSIGTINGFIVTLK